MTLLSIICNFIFCYFIQVSNNVCTKDSCVDGDCTTVYRFRPDDSFAIMTDSESYVSVPHDATFKCTCKPGAAGSLPATNLLLYVIY